MKITPPGNSPVVSGVNGNGVVIGEVTPYGLTGATAVFTDDRGVYTNYVPPGASASFSGVINNQGEIAGLYQSKTGATQGFVFKAGTYTQFVLPRLGTTIREPQIEAINNAGRVVGVYEDAGKHVQHAFLFNGTKLSLIGAFPPNDNIHAALNDEGSILVSTTAAVWARPSRGVCFALAKVADFANPGSSAFPLTPLKWSLALKNDGGSGGNGTFPPALTSPTAAHTAAKPQA